MIFFVILERCHRPVIPAKAGIQFSESAIYASEQYISS
ncbi:Uncharacterized protein dnm_015920 [Desulfonema magnum]|uniref:Uncharacterized protein n=1 Tax=Desulfonema magnum TaxID=45655 RepID=A0A975BHR2_9BACT|nr:Uncharacterized protein dnm_015920 [Desulfonema magnum]